MHIGYLNFWYALLLLVDPRALDFGFIIMDSRVPFTTPFTATPPMMPPHFMGAEPSVFYNGMHDYNTQFAPWVSSHFSVDMPSHVQPPPWPTYMNPSIGSGGTISPMATSSFDMNRFPMGGWNLPPYGSNPSYSLLGSNAHMGAYYTPSMYLSSTMSVSLNTFSIPGPQVPPGILYGENQFYDSSYPPYGTPSQGGNIYPHSNNSYPTSVSL
jgi:hypothetical protein